MSNFENYVQTLFNATTFIKDPDGEQSQDW